MNEEPVAKKMRLEETDEKVQDVVNYINYIRSSTKHLSAILDDELINPIPTIQMHVGLIKNTKDISKTIQILNEKVPLNDLSHLKRVRKNLILLCPLNTIDISIQDFIQRKIPELSNTFDNFEEVPVPKHAPKLKRQHAEVNKIWSCNFHPNIYMEKLSSDNFFTTQDLKLHRLFMSIAFEAALWHLKETKGILTKELLAEKNICVVVDPSINSIVAISLDNREFHSVQHAAMIAIDNVSKTQCGGAWDCKRNTETLIQNLDCSLDGIDQELLNYLKERFSSINFGAKQFKSKEDLQIEDKTNSDGPYLCTNYYIYMLREPCLMCAMALVHARVKRLFFCYDNPTFGALKSKTKLHTVSSLNHHYEVFTGFL